MINLSWADKVENDDDILPTLPLSWNTQSKPLQPCNTNSNPLQPHNSNFTKSTTHKQKLSSNNMTISNIIQSLPPIDNQHYSMAVYLSNALKLPRRDIIIAIFTVRAPLLHYKNKHIADVLHQLLNVQNYSLENHT